MFFKTGPIRSAHFVRAHRRRKRKEGASGRGPDASQGGVQRTGGNGGQSHNRRSRVIYLYRIN